MTATYTGEPVARTLPGLLGGDVRMEFTPASVPGTGAVVLKQRRCLTTYAVGPLVTDLAAARGFRFIKIGGGSDADVTDLDVLVFRDGRTECGCRGKARWGRCKHAAAAVELCDLIPEPKEYRDAED
jgi:hypothetical protein